jgi:predicted amidophosphoribosyltransferase
MYCKKCYYDLRKLAERRCPECGARFDPLDSESYLTRPPNLRARMFGRILLVLVVALIAAFVIMLHLAPSIFFGPPSGH